MTFTVPRFTRMVVLVLLIGALSSAAWAKEVALVVSKSSQLKGVQSAEVIKAFKTPPAKWADGREIVFVMKAPSSSETRVFGTKFLNWPVEQLPASFSDSKKTFLFVATDEEVIKAVNNMPNAFGVVDLYSINGSVTVLKIDGKLPLEPGYMLHYN